MELAQDLTDRLDALTAALDDGSDLQTVLEVLADDLTSAVSSFAGLSLTVHVQDGSFTLSALNSRPAVTSMLLPLHPGAAATPDTDIVFYAGSPGAFVDLAADADVAFGQHRNIVLDQHLPPPTAAESARCLTALSDRSAIDQAIGFLTEQGHTPRRRGPSWNPGPAPGSAPSPASPGIFSTGGHRHDRARGARQPDARPDRRQF